MMILYKHGTETINNLVCLDGTSVPAPGDHIIERDKTWEVRTVTSNIVLGGLVVTVQLMELAPYGS